MQIQVIHSLQTKNDEHEEITEQLQTKHGTKVQQLTADLVALQRKIGEEKERTCQLEIESRAAEEEKTKLIKSQVTYHLIFASCSCFNYIHCCVYRRNTVLTLRKDFLN